jgi:hypothetical protein
MVLFDAVKLITAVTPLDMLCVVGDSEHEGVGAAVTTKSPLVPHVAVPPGPVTVIIMLCDPADNNDPA